MPGFGEREAIALLEGLFASGQRRGEIELGIGDDAALIRIGNEHLVWTVDASVEHVHFNLDWLDPADVGWRSFHAAASDLAAMGARPIAALSSLVVPRGLSKRDLQRIGQGQAEAAQSIRCPIVGGNLARGSELGITTTLLGRSARPLTRAAARNGDELWLIGDVGLARAGLLLVERHARARSVAARRAIAAWRRPRALIERGLALVGRAHAAVDVSDGVAGDALHIAEASRVRIVIEAGRFERALPAELGGAARSLEQSAIELALEGGEDYALLATGPSSRRPRWARRIGRVERGRGVFIERDGKRAALSGGFDHLR